MFDVLGRQLKMGDLVVFNDTFALVVGENTLLVEDSFNLTGYSLKDWGVSVILITNLDKEEKAVLDKLKELYMRHIRREKFDLSMGSIYISTTGKRDKAYVYVGQGIVETEKSSERNRFCPVTKKVESGHLFFVLEEFTFINTTVRNNHVLDFVEMLQYGTPEYKIIPKIKDSMKFHKVDEGVNIVYPVGLSYSYNRAIRDKEYGVLNAHVTVTFTDGIV